MMVKITNETEAMKSVLAMIGQAAVAELYRRATVKLGESESSVRKLYKETKDHKGYNQPGSTTKEAVGLLATIRHGGGDLRDVFRVLMWPIVDMVAKNKPDTDKDVLIEEMTEQMMLAVGTCIKDHAKADWFYKEEADE